MPGLTIKHLDILNFIVNLIVKVYMYGNNQVSDKQNAVLLSNERCETAGLSGPAASLFTVGFQRTGISPLWLGHQIIERANKGRMILPMTLYVCECDTIQLQSEVKQSLCI